MKERAIAVSEACQKAEEIKSMHQYLARVEQRAFLNSLGVDCDAYLNSSGSDDSEEESEDGKEDFSDTEERQVTGEENNSSQNSEQSEEIGSDTPPNPVVTECFADNAHGTSVGPDGNSASGRGEIHRSSTSPYENMPEIDVNSVVVLDIRREVHFNWFALVDLLRPKFESRGCTDEVFDRPVTCLC